MTLKFNLISPLVIILQAVSEPQILIQTEHSLFKEPSIFFYYGSHS